MLIAVCDDEKIELEQTENIIKKVFDEMQLQYSINVFTDINEMLKHTPMYDVVFLDIELQNPEQNGIWAAKIIKENNPDCTIIFTTNHEEYIDEVIEKYAFRYWSKPIDEYRLRKSVVAMIERTKTITVEIYKSKQKLTLPMSDIIYITPKDKRCQIITVSDEYITMESFKELRGKFTANNFYDCHGSYCVNLNYVEKYTKAEVGLRYGTKKYVVHMSRRYYKSFKERMFIAGGEKV